MDADSSYGGSDTAQDSTSGHDNNSSMETTHDHHDSNQQHHASPKADDNQFYHKNEITLPVNYDETDDTQGKSPKMAHYLSTANLNINETLENHSNLEELNKQYGSTHRLNPGTPSPRKKSSGVDNAGFQNDDDGRHETNGVVRSTFDEKKTYNNGDLNSPLALGLSTPTKNDDQMTEAVNLELINLKPGGKDVTGPYEYSNNGISTIPVKKETEVEIGNPYDEYFVPVNEHRKYMSSTRKGRNSVTFADSVATSGIDDCGLSVTRPERGVLDYPDWLMALDNPRGEKLYVTMDKRNKKKRNKCLCWGICLATVAAALIVGILAAVGIIGNQDAHPAQEVSARHLGGSSTTTSTSDNPDVKAAGIFGISSDVPEQKTNEPLTPSLPISTVPNLPSTETSMIQVPHALESQLVIDNLQFTPELAHRNSSEFQELAEILQRHLKSILFNSNELDDGTADIELKVLDFMPGSVVVRYRVGWTFKDGLQHPVDPLDEDYLVHKLKTALTQHMGYLNNRYRIPEHTVVAEKIIDLCQIDNNGCEHTCSFDYKVVDFVCGCPQDQYLKSDGKTCAHGAIVESEAGLGHEPKAEPTPEPTAQPEPEPEPEPKVETSPRPEPEPSTEMETITDFNFYTKHDHHDHLQPNAITESDLVHETGTDFVYGKHISQIPETTPEPSAEPEPTPEPEPKSEPEPKETSTEFSASIHIVPFTEAIEPSAEPEPTPEPEPKPEPEPNETSTEFSASIRIVPFTEAIEQPEFTIKPETSHDMAIHTSSPEPKTESTPQPEINTEPNSLPEPSVELTSQLEAKVEPSSLPEPTSQPEPAIVDVNSIVKSLKPEPPTTQAEENIETTWQPEPTSPIEPSEESPKAEPEPSAEPTTSQPGLNSVEVSSINKSREEAKKNTSKLEQSEKYVETATPTAEPEPSAEPKTSRPELKVAEVASVDTNDTSKFEPTTNQSVHNMQSTSQTAPNSTLTPNEESPKAEPEPSGEPTTSQPEMADVEVSSIIKSVGQNISQIEKTKYLMAETTVEPQPEPEPTAELTAKPSVQPPPFFEHIISNNSHEIVNENVTKMRQSKLADHNEDVEYTYERSTMIPSTFGQLEDNKLDASTTERVMEELKVVNETNVTSPNGIKLETQKLFNVETTALPKEIEDVTTDNENVTDTQTHSVSVSVNASNEDIPADIYNLSEPAQTESSLGSVLTTTQGVFIPVVINNEVHEIQSSDVVSGTTEIDVETESGKMSSLAVTEPIPQTTQKPVLVIDTTESVNALEHMSPFLPEIDNDTLIDMHSEVDHYMQMQNETDVHYEIKQSTRSPRLDDDEMNTTNPFDLNPVDAGLSVIPLAGNDSKEMTVQPPTNLITIRNSNETINEIPLTSSGNLQFTTNKIELQTTVAPIAETTTKLAETATVNLTLSPLILNNVHSSHYFETITKDALRKSLETEVGASKNEEETTTIEEDFNENLVSDGTENTMELTTTDRIDMAKDEEATNRNEETVAINRHEQEITTMASTDESQENSIHGNYQVTFKDFNTSTEDLVAMETTTNALKQNFKQEQSTNPVPAIGIKGHNIKIEDMTTVRADMIQTITELVHFDEESNFTSPENETITESSLLQGTVEAEMKATLFKTTINDTNEISDRSDNIIVTDLLRIENEKKEENVTATQLTNENNQVNETATGIGLLKSEENGTATDILPIKIETSQGNETTTHVSLLKSEENSTATAMFPLRTEDSQLNETKTAINLLKSQENGPSKNETTITFVVQENETATETILPKTTTKHQYEVSEAILDVTTSPNLLLLRTTEKIFEETTTAHDIIQPGGDDELLLSVIPLHTQEDLSKLSKKRVAEDESFNKLEDDSSNLNIINEEEASVLEKFKHQINDIHDETDLVTSEQPIVENDLTGTDTVYKASPEKSNKKSTYINEKKELYDKKLKAEKQFEATYTTISKTTDDVPIATTSTSIDSDKSVNNIKPVTEGFTLTGFSRCAIGQFQCVNGTSLKDGSYCIPRNDRCDSVDDCSDASDEAGCVEEGCPNNFQCASGQCLKRHLVCDGILNCNDGSDEMNCDTWECNFDEFQCEIGGRCVPLSWKCDGLAQCPNANDEYNCHQALCDNNEFQCVQQDTCVPLSWRCDGKPDCFNDEDEKLCDCGIDQFKCSMGGGCINLELRCDGIEQCADRSDEWNCIKIGAPDFITLDRPDRQQVNTSYIQILSPNNTWHLVCSDLWNTTYSDSVCRGLGYIGATLTEHSAPPIGLNWDQFFRLKPQLQHGLDLLTQFERTENKCNQVVSVTCQEFTCGSYSALDVQSARIISGSSANEMQWPSVTLLYNRKLNVQCTASLVAPSWVIASYSCVSGKPPGFLTNPKDWTLYAGGTHFFNNADNSSTQIRSVLDIIPHPQVKYEQFEYNNDAVLLELSTPLTLGRNVSAICLPNKEIEPRQLCVTAGWGVSKPGDSNVQKYLHYLPVPTIDSNECNSTKHYNGQISADKICAGYTESDKTPCYNDEGAPLMCFSEHADTWELHGILSHHSNCGRSRHPSIYTSINASMRHWIANTIGSRAFERSS